MIETPGAKIRENFGKSKRPRQGRYSRQETRRGREKKLIFTLGSVQVRVKEVCIKEAIADKLSTADGKDGGKKMDARSFVGKRYLARI